MVRKFPPFRSERKKRSTSEGTPQFPNRISGKLPYHLTSNRNFRIFSPNGKHPICCVRLATVLWCVATCWVLLAQVWNWSNLSQHVATCRNKVAKRTQHVAPNNVAICCVGMLRSFGRGLMRNVLLQWLFTSGRRVHKFPAVSRCTTWSRASPK